MSGVTLRLGLQSLLELVANEMAIEAVQADGALCKYYANTLAYIRARRARESFTNVHLSVELSTDLDGHSLGLLLWLVVLPGLFVTLKHQHTYLPFHHKHQRDDRARAKHSFEVGVHVLARRSVQAHIQQDAQSDTMRHACLSGVPAAVEARTARRTSRSNTRTCSSDRRSARECSCR